MEALERLRRWWAATGAAIEVRPTHPVAIHALEDRYGIAFPEDFRRYLLTSCPAEENWDDENTNWWPLHRIRNIPDEYEPEISDEEIAADAGKYLFFADNFIWAWAWAISCTDDGNRGRVAVIGGTDRFVASSFTEFVDRYLTDFNSVC